jgi:uncharacterized membrane protein
MAIGPIQLLAIGFKQPDFQGEILDEIEKLRRSDTVRIIDSLTVYKDENGDVAALEMSNLQDDEKLELGAVVGALIGLGMDGEEGMVAGAEAGAEAVAAGGADVFDADDAWDVMETIPNGTAAAILLIEHHWAVGLRDAIARAGGFRLTEGFIDPFDLVAIGFLTAEEAEAHAALDAEAAAEA